MSNLEERIRSALDDDLQLLDLARAQDVLERVAGFRPARTTFWRWALHGVRRTNGERVRLALTRIGKRQFVSVEELVRFVEATSGGAGHPAPVAHATSRRRAAARVAAEAGL